MNMSLSFIISLKGRSLNYRRPLHIFYIFKKSDHITSLLSKAATFSYNTGTQTTVFYPWRGGLQEAIRYIQPLPPQHFVTNFIKCSLVSKKSYTKVKWWFFADVNWDDFLQNPQKFNPYLQKESTMLVLLSGIPMIAVALRHCSSFISNISKHEEKLLSRGICVSWWKLLSLLTTLLIFFFHSTLLAINLMDNWIQHHLLRCFPLNGGRQQKNSIYHTYKEHIATLVALLVYLV